MENEREREKERTRENSNSKNNELFGIQMSSQDELHNTFQIFANLIILKGLFKNMIIKIISRV